MTRQHKPPDDTLEDLTWLDEHGVGATDAAKRTGFTSPQAMEKWLDRHDHHPLWLRFKARDPEGAHNYRRLRMTETTTTDTIGTLITQAQQSTRKRTRTKADRLSDLVADLRKTLDLEAHEDKARETARKDVERLTRELADAKARLKGGNNTTPEVTAAEIRAWAQTEGVACPRHGRIPDAVREAYQDATSQRVS